MNGTECGGVGELRAGRVVDRPAERFGVWQGDGPGNESPSTGALGALARFEAIVSAGRAMPIGGGGRG